MPTGSSGSSGGQGPERGFSVLVARDRGASHDTLISRLHRAGFAVIEATDGESAWATFQQQTFDLVVTDLHVPELDGIALISRIRSARSRDARVPLFLMTSAATLSIAAAAGRAGVTDCFPLDGDGISSLLERARALLETDRPPMPYVLLGSSPAIAVARERLLSLAALSTPVLVAGERGTGHAQVVAYLHKTGRRAESPLRHIDCSAQPTATAGPEQGTWYLHEVQDLAPHAQAAWHQLILESQVSIDGGEARVIASTTRDLRALVAQKSFASDLARDLCQFEVWLPPLRERRDDLPKLVQASLEVVSERLGRPGVGIAPAALERLCACPWWDNCSGLESVIESLVAFAPGLEIAEAQAELVLLDSDPVARAARERARSEREQLLSLLEECGGNFTHMGEQLKVDRGTIRYRLRKHGILPRAGSRGETQNDDV